MQSKPCDPILLILDLDETLIYASEEPLEQEADFRVEQYAVYQRPGLQAFLRSLKPTFEVAIWTTGTDNYAIKIADKIEPEPGFFSLIWGRSKCTVRWDPERDKHEFEKRLAKLKTKGYSLERMLIVDDTREKCRCNYGNAIYINPFYGEPDDQELNLLGQYLPTLANAENVRTLEKRDWRIKTLRNQLS